MPRKTGGELLLPDLPDELLLLILMYCDVTCLGRFAQTCQKFRRLAYEDIVWLERCRKLTFSYIQPRHFFRDEKSVKDKYHIATNWDRGKFTNAVLYKTVLKQMSQVCLTCDNLWFTYKACVRQYMLRQDGSRYDRPLMVYKAFSQDVSCFAQNQHNVVATGIKGSMAVWHDGDLVFNGDRCHSDTIHSVDIHHNMIVTGGRDAKVKIWSIGEYSEDGDMLRRTLNIGDRVWSVTLSPLGHHVVTGTAGLNGIKPLSLWDIESGSELDSPCHSYRRGAGILCLQYESPHCLLSCGYDTAVRMWDLRLNKCVKEWYDPYDYTVYCVRSNRHQAIVSGTCRHGLVRLWDKRMTKPRQSYYIGNNNSPVYSLAFNQTNLYVGLERTINVLHFDI